MSIYVSSCKNTKDFRKHNLSVPESQKESDLASKLKKRGEKIRKITSCRDKLISSCLEIMTFLCVMLCAI